VNRHDLFENYPLPPQVLISAAASLSSPRTLQVTVDPSSIFYSAASPQQPFLGALLTLCL
jgi:hypothetical protein